MSMIIKKSGKKTSNKLFNNNKVGGLIITLSILFLTILLLNINFASAAACVVTTSNNCQSPNSIIMYLSGSTNTHASINSVTGYNNVLCCDFDVGNSVTCSGSNTILKLFSATNAHAERPEGTIYTQSICYENIGNTLSSTGTQPGREEVEIVSLSSATNAHITGYSLKVIGTPTAATCDLTDAYWSPAGKVANGTTVQMIVNGTQECGGAEISFEVKRGTTSITTMTGTWQEGSPGIIQTWVTNPPSDTNYSFVASVVANPSENIQSPANLKVVEEPPYCQKTPFSTAVICGDLKNQNDCSAINQCSQGSQVAQNSIGEKVNCADPNIDCSCSWNNNAGVCDAVWNAITTGYCGDGIVQASLNEDCDGTNFGDINSCTNFDLTDGTLTCNAPGTPNKCKFNTSGCIGPSGICGDKTINPGETCDSGIGSLSCVNIDAFTSGQLICSSNCQLNTTQCIGGPEFKSNVGTCAYTQSTTDTCDDDGFLTFSWTAAWTWDSTCDATCQAENQNLKNQCQPGSRTVECPAQIALPFFNVYNLIAVILIIAMIYWVMQMKKVRRKKREKRER